VQTKLGMLFHAEYRVAFEAQGVARTSLISLQDGVNLLFNADFYGGESFLNTGATLTSTPYWVSSFIFSTCCVGAAISG
jgi:hypothetical protein